MYQLEDSVFNSMLTHDVKVLREIFNKYKYEIRIAGGAVRDVLMGKEPKDLDFATTATVEEMKEMFTKERVTTIYSYGEKHGTVIACIKHPQQFQITTINIRTPGRPTEEDWKNYARRRDLTMNSMFLDFDGKVFDYLGGANDLKKREVRFTGDADLLIKADFLRILRYFRFHSQFARKPEQHEHGVLQAIKANVEGLRHRSGERIWNELKMILEEKSRDVVIRTMMDVGIGPYIGLPSPNLAEFQNVCRMNKDTDIQPASLLAALCHNTTDTSRLHSRLKYSNYEIKLINYILNNRANTSSDDSLLPYLKLIYCEAKLSRDIVTKYVMELLRYKGRQELLGELHKISKFPIDKMMLKAKGVPVGTNVKSRRKFKFVVAKLVECWYATDYDSCAKQLLKSLPNILEQYRQIE